MNSEGFSYKGEGQALASKVSGHLLNTQTLKNHKPHYGTPGHFFLFYGLEFFTVILKQVIENDHLDVDGRSQIFL